MTFHDRLWNLLAESGGPPSESLATTVFLLGVQVAFVSPEWAQAALQMVDRESLEVAGLPMRPVRESAARGLISRLPVEVSG